MLCNKYTFAFFFFFFFLFGLDGGFAASMVTFCKSGGKVCVVVFACFLEIAFLLSLALYDIMWVDVCVFFFVLFWLSVKWPSSVCVALACCFGVSTALGGLAKEKR